MKRTSLARIGLAAVTVAALLGAAACGGYGGSAPTAPELAAPPDGAIIVTIVGERGALSFSPDPATIPAGQPVSWHNADNTIHHVVLNDGRLDAGNIGPGRYSPAMTLPDAGGYHCSIHPDMVGTLAAQ